MKFKKIGLQTLRDKSAELNTPLCFTALEAGSSVAMKHWSTASTQSGDVEGISLDYSFDRIYWQNWNFSAIMLPKVGSKVYIRATTANERISTADSATNRFDLTGKIAASGNIISLLDKTLQQTTITSYAFARLFAEQSALVTPPYFNAAEINMYGCQRTFQDCTSLLYAPELPMTTLANRAYMRMFDGCTSMKYPPSILPASNIPAYAYGYMFSECSSLEYGTDILATTVSSTSSIRNMYLDCINLKYTGRIHLTNEYDDVAFTSFCWGCSKLTCVNVDLIKWPVNLTNGWLEGVPSHGTFICPTSLEVIYGPTYIPNGWTVVKK